MKKFLSILSIVMGFSTLQAQLTPQPQTYMYNGLALNPAYAGSRECLSILGMHSSQWVGIEGAPTTDYLTLHSPVGKNHALGINLFNDRIGVQNHTGIYTNYAYHLKLGETQKLSFGVSAGISVFAKRESEIKTLESDATFSENNQRTYTPNIGSGLYYYSSKFYFGISVPLLFSKAQGQVAHSNPFRIDPNYTVFTAMSGFLIELGSKVVWKPSVLFSNMGGNYSYSSINSNFYFNKKWNFGLGLSYSRSVSGMIGFQLNENFDVAYNYTYTTFYLGKYTSGSHEIMLRYELRKKVSSLNSRYF